MTASQNYDDSSLRGLLSVTAVNVNVVNVAVVSGDAFGRAGLTALLESQPGLAVTPQAAGGVLNGAGARFDGGGSDVVAWDLGQQPETELDHLRERAGILPPVVALVPAAERAGDALSAGARAILPRDVDAVKLAQALRAASQGLYVLHEDFASLLSPLRAPRDDSAPESVTPREREVLQQLAAGLSNRGIAERLAISEHTAKFHVNSILSKLGARGRTEAVVRAARLGLIAL